MKKLLITLAIIATLASCKKEEQLVPTVYHTYNKYSIRDSVLSEPLYFALPDSLPGGSELFQPNDNPDSLYIVTHEYQYPITTSDTSLMNYLESLSGDTTSISISGNIDFYIIHITKD